jgi:hypothetical protein
MDQSQDATRIHLGNIYNSKKKTQELFNRYYFTVANANVHNTCYGVALPDISSRARLIDI